MKYKRLEALCVVQDSSEVFRLLSNDRDPGSVNLSTARLPEGPTQSRQVAVAVFFAPGI